MGLRKRHLPAGPEAEAALTAQNSTPLFVARPFLPDIDALLPHLKNILESGFVTNNGPYLKQLENKLGTFLDAPNLSVVTNGTLGLELALRSLKLKGEVICPAFSFPATYHVLMQGGPLTPVFADIDNDYGLCPQAVEDAITDKTTAILAVHTYGYPCQHQALSTIAKKYNLALIYDAAHAFGVRVNNESISRWGDASVFSLHATKVFTTLEGGIVVSNSDQTHRNVQLERNFGFEDEDLISCFGLNAKMDEFRAAIGLTALSKLHQAIEYRRSIVEQYRVFFKDLKADAFYISEHIYQNPAYELNGAYFPIRVRPTRDIDRDKLYRLLRENEVIARKYFHPCVVDLPLYQPWVQKEKLSKTIEISKQILCLPVHHEVRAQDLEKITGIIASSIR